MNRIILIGFMGAGKTSLGKELARELKIPFIDTDEMIELNHKLSVNQIFEQFGEGYFREQELLILNSVAELSDFVLSVGGGLPCQEGRMTKLNKLGQTIYLKHDPETLIHRLEKDKANRPLLQLVDLNTFVNLKLAEREPYYSQAEFILDNKHQSLDNLLSILGLPQKN